MATDASEPDEMVKRVHGIPRPTPQFRRRAWRLFQRALDPLAPPKPLRRPERF